MLLNGEEEEEEILDESSDRLYRDLSADLAVVSPSSSSSTKQSNEYPPSTLISEQ